LAFNGKALVDLGSIDQQPGTIKLTASADGLTSTTISVTAVSGTSSDW
jgi:hypothetical protein